MRLEIHFKHLKNKHVLGHSQVMLYKDINCLLSLACLNEILFVIDHIMHDSMLFVFS